MSAGETRRLSVPATDEGIRAALDALEGLWTAQGVSRAVTWPVAVSLDEVLANVVHHALAGRGDSARVELELQLEPGDPPRCELRVEDDGPASIRSLRSRRTLQPASTSARSEAWGSSW